MTTRKVYCPECDCNRLSMHVMTTGVIRFDNTPENYEIETVELDASFDEGGEAECTECHHTASFKEFVHQV